MNRPRHALPDGLRKGVALLAVLLLVGLVVACSAAPTPQQEAPKAPAAAQPTTAPAPASQQPTTAPAAQSVAQPTAAQAQAPTQAPAAAPTKFSEAPQLAALVKEGKLPAVEQRLPKTPVVVPVVEKIGKYGGTWRTSLLGGADTVWLDRTIGYENLVRWDPEWRTVIPNVAASFQASPDAKEFTFKLREGMKWSDGEPFTADDILFWYEDVSMNKQLTPNRGNNPPTVEKVDQYTVKFKFEKSNGLFIQTLATTTGEEYVRYPKHYLQQFHIKYNPDKVEQLAKENNAENWVKLFQIKGSSVPGTPSNAMWSNPDLPTLHAWRITTPYGGGDRVVADRNPYYFKADPQGNQLPYIDRVTYQVAQNAEVLVLKAASGEIDMQDRNITTLQNKAVLTDNMQKGNYRFIDEVTATMNTNTIALNLTHKDPVKRQIFQNKDFRIGLSYAINRQEIIDLVYVGQGQPFQNAPRPESPFYDEKMAKQYTEYSVAKANEYLDKAGFAKKDGDGFRLGPDGKRISIVIEVAAAQTVQVDSMQRVAEHWKKVGIDAQVKPQDRSLFDQRRGANEHDVVVWDGAGGLDVVVNPPYYFPWGTRSDYAQAWASWYVNPTGAGAQTKPEEPPAATKKQMELYRQLEATGDIAKQNELMKQVLAIAADEFYTIGISLPANMYGIVKNNMRNVPKVMPNAFTYPNPAPTNPAQYFFE